MEIKDLFVETKKAIDNYKEKVEEIDHQEQELNTEKVAIQMDISANLLSREGADLSERIYLTEQAKGLNSKVEIVNTMLEELEEKRTALKLSFVPIYQNAIRQDRKLQAEYDVTSIVEKHRNIMLTEIAEIGKAMQKQYSEVAPDVHEVYRDSAVTEQHPQLDYHFSAESNKPFFSWYSKSVVSRDEVFSATWGMLPSDISSKQKDVK